MAYIAEGTSAGTVYAQNLIRQIVIPEPSDHDRCCTISEARGIVLDPELQLTSFPYYKNSEQEDIRETNPVKPGGPVPKSI